MALSFSLPRLSGHPPAQPAAARPTDPADPYTTEVVHGIDTVEARLAELATAGRSDVEVVVLGADTFAVRWR